MSKPFLDSVLSSNYNTSLADTTEQARAIGDPDPFQEEVELD